MAIKVSLERIEKLSDLIRSIGIKTIYYIEDHDKQFEAMKILHSRTKHTGYVCLLAVSNALISYRLSMKGEDYWLLFAKYFSKTHPNFFKALDNIVNFLNTYKVNRILLKQKISRLRKFYESRISRTLFEKPWYYSKDITKLWRELARNLNTSPRRKTIVFSVKMFYYAYYASTGVRISLPYEIPIPVDFRVALISLTSGLISINSRNLREKANLLLAKYDETVRDVWKIISQKTNIPPLNLDALVWVLGKYVSTRCNKNLIVSRTINYLEEEVFKKNLSKLMNTLVYEFFKYC